MKQQVMGVAILVLLACLACSGCQQKNSATSNVSSQNVFLESTVVKFANVSLEKTAAKPGQVDSAKVSWLFTNIAGRMINITIDVRFYDKTNVMLYNQTRWLRYMPKGYTEQSMSPTANMVTFADQKASLVDHVVITATEM
ncbi:MAG TPA: hypothetical protein VMT57_05100 [Candidatus Thermoplasmatota archaeon]|nr:hypothetical protein [Candidatus Thermoplasmatota archaeon]